VGRVRNITEIVALGINAIEPRLRQKGARLSISVAVLHNHIRFVHLEEGCFNANSPCLDALKSCVSAWLGSAPSNEHLSFPPIIPRSYSIDLLIFLGFPIAITRLRSVTKLSSFPLTYLYFNILRTKPLDFPNI
jgi:hypothetical protein